MAKTGYTTKGAASPTATSVAQAMNWTCPECGARKEDFEMVQV